MTEPHRIPIVGELRDSDERKLSEYDRVRERARQLGAHRGWREIETAPKDGTQVLVWPSGGEQEVGVANWWDDSMGWFHTVELWAPIPEDGWQAIDTAPRDGTTVLLDAGEGLKRPYTDRYGWGSWVDIATLMDGPGVEPDWGWLNTSDGPPVRWRPMPKPPHV
jgi:hypothetical protein